MLLSPVIIHPQPVVGLFDEGSSTTTILTNSQLDASRGRQLTPCRLTCYASGQRGCSFELFGATRHIKRPLDTAWYCAQE